MSEEYLRAQTNGGEGLQGFRGLSSWSLGSVVFKAAVRQFIMAEELADKCHSARGQGW